MAKEKDLSGKGAGKGPAGPGTQPQAIPKANKSGSKPAGGGGKK